MQINEGYITFDDTVANKAQSHEIVGVRQQYSGNTGGTVKRIGIVTCVYISRRDRF